MNTTDSKQAVEARSPLADVAQEQILTRLRQALSLAEEDCAGHAAGLQELFSDLADRSQALELVAGLDAEDQAPRACSLLTCTTLSAAGGEPVREFLLIAFGEVGVERPCAGGTFVFTRKHAESAVGWFNGLGRKLAIDYEHQSFDRFNTRGDGLRPAAGWIGGLEIREDGLWAVEVTWTERATELLRGGEYRYFSPVIFWSDEDQSELAGLGPVGLTNDPAMRQVPPLAATRRADDQDAGETLDDTGTPSEAREGEWAAAAQAELGEAEAEIALLKKELAAQEADTFVERGMRLGKILESTSMDWREDYLRDAGGAEQRLARVPVLLPPGRVLALDRRGEVEPLAEAEREFRRNGEVYRRWGVEAEDLAAYERAWSAGRILHSGARA